MFSVVFAFQPVHSLYFHLPKGSFEEMLKAKNPAELLESVSCTAAPFLGYCVTCEIFILRRKSWFMVIGTGCGCELWILLVSLPKRFC